LGGCQVILQWTGTGRETFYLRGLKRQETWIWCTVMPVGHRVPKTQKPPQNCKRQERDMEQFPYWGAKVQKIVAVAIWHMGFVLPSVTQHREGLLIFCVSYCLQCHRCIGIELYAGSPGLHWDRKTANFYVVRQSRDKGPLWKPRRRWKVNIKMNLEDMRFENIDWTQLAQDRVKETYSCEHGNWPPCSVINANYFLTAWLKHQPFKDSSTGLVI
jgi:hypothetical protein